MADASRAVEAKKVRVHVFVDKGSTGASEDAVRGYLSALPVEIAMHPWLDSKGIQDGDGAKAACMMMVVDILQKARSCHENLGNGGARMLIFSSNPAVEYAAVYLRSLGICAHTASVEPNAGMGADLVIKLRLAQAARAIKPIQTKTINAAKVNPLDSAALRRGVDFLMEYGGRVVSEEELVLLRLAEQRMKHMMDSFPRPWWKRPRTFVGLVRHTHQNMLRLRKKCSKGTLGRLVAFGVFWLYTSGIVDYKRRELMGLVSGDPRAKKMKDCKIYWRI